MTRPIGPPRDPRFPATEAARRARRLGRHLAVGLVAGSLLAVGAAPEPARAASPESEEYVDDARSRLEAGDANGAFIQLRNALQADPDNAVARGLLGQLYLGAGEYDAAEKEFARFLELEPGDQQISLLLARARFAQGDHEGALASLPENPSDAELARNVRLLRAETYLAMGRAQDAMALVEEMRARSLTDVQVSVLAARAALAMDDLEEAERFAREATETNQESAAAWLVRARVALTRQDLESAAGYAERADRLAPGNVAPGLVLAEIDLRRARLEAAEKTIDALLEIQPEAIETRYLKAAQLVAEQDFEGAEEILDQLRDRLRDYRPAQFLTALVKYNVGRYAQARTQIERYLSADPRNLAAQRLHGAILLRSDSPVRAAEVLESAAAQAPGQAATLRLLATAQMRAGDFTAATETLGRLSEVAQGEQAAQARSLAEALNVGSGESEVEGEALAGAVAVILNDLQLGELDSAEERARALVGEHPDNPVAHNTLAGVLLAQGKNEEARGALEKALAIDEDFRAAYQNLDRLDSRTGDSEAIEERRSAYLERNPNDPWGVLHYASFLRDQDRGGEARDLVEQALEEHPDNRELLVGAVNLALSGDNEDAAADKAERLGQRLPQDPRAQLLAGQALMRLDRFAQAAERFERARILTPQSETLPLELLIQAQVSAEDLVAAEQAAVQLVEARPTAYEAHRLLVDLYLRNDKQAELEQLLARVGERDAELQARLRAHAAMAGGEPGRAAEILAAVEEPSAATVEQRFEARREAGAADEAREQLSRWVEQHPEATGPAMRLANLLIAERAYEEAEAVLTAALPGAPRNNFLLNNLAWLRFTLDKEGAEALARRALEVAPDSSDVQDTLGWILARKGETAEAETLLRRAARSAPRDPAIAYHLAYVLAENGSSEDAVRILERITESRPGAGAAEDAQALLAELRRSDGGAE